jgi:hypothetical protein
MFYCHLFVSHYLINYTFVTEKMGGVARPYSVLYIKQRIIQHKYTL